MLVGKPKGKLINWMAGEVSTEIADALQAGSKKIDKIKQERDERNGVIRRKIQDKAIDAEDAFHKAEARLEKTRQDLSIVNAKKKVDQLDDYKFML